MDEQGPPNEQGAGPGAAPRIVVEQLSRGFPGVVAVSELSFTVDAGEVFGLVGPDGAGKTTALRMLAGVLAPDGGTVRIAGADLATDIERARRRLSYMPQRFGLYEDLTVDENIRFYADLFGVPGAERIARARELLAAAGLSEFGRRLAGALSGGMKQKLGLVCALVHTPEVLLLDEPTNGVDPVSRREFWSLLYQLAERGVSVLVATAYLDEAERCHRVGLIHRGGLLSCDTPARLRERLAGRVLRLTTPDPRALRAALERMEGVETVMPTGDALRMVVDDAAKRLPALRALVEAQAPTGSALSEVTPSIEDLFAVSVEEAGGSAARRG